MASHHEYVQKLRNQLEEWDYELDRLEHRLEDLGNEGRRRAEEKLEEARQYRRDVEGKLKKLESSTGNALEDIREGLELAWDGLKTGFAAARSEFEDDSRK